jgi:hypothetical protein
LSQFDPARPLLTFFVFYDIFVTPPLIACSFLALAPLGYKCTLMPLGLVITMIIVLCQPIVFSLALP